jgi:hypothetical protein
VQTKAVQWTQVHAVDDLDDAATAFVEWACPESVTTRSD